MNQKIGKIICNGCGKEICTTEQEAMTPFLKIEQNWGYFSRRDGVRHKIILCEDCYEAFLRTLTIPPEEEEIKELL